VPLADRARSLGALVLGRTQERYDESDEELASVLGRFIARLVVRAAAVDRENTAQPDPDREWEDEAQLTGS
jgi:GAF domain-containing protein